MSTKKNRSRNTSTVKKVSMRKNVKDKTQARKDAFTNLAKEKAKGTGSRKGQSMQSYSKGLQAEFSTILREPGHDLQEDIEEESFNPQFHSTAVYAEDDDLSEKSKLPNEKLTSPSISLQKRENVSALKIKTIASNKPNSTATNISLEKTQQKSPGKSAVKEKSSPNKKRPQKADRRDVVQLKIWSPEDVPRTARDLNELDVILYECEKVVEKFRESADTDTSRNAVDVFLNHFKDQLTKSIKAVQMLVNLKRKNAKVQLEIGRKQKRLIEVRDEIITKKPRLNQLQKECFEVEKRQKSLKDANIFLENLKQLQENYRKSKAENPQIKENYGVSSLPACLIQAQTILKAEQHFHNVNRQLQNLLKKVTEKR